MKYQTLGAAASLNPPPKPPPPSDRRTGDQSSTDDADSELMTPTWMPWSGSYRPCTSTEEKVFRISLNALAGDDAAEVRRRDVTAVLNGLRCGLTVDGLIERAPGLEPVRLRAAYEHLDALRLRAADAWRDIVADPCAETFDLRAPVAATMLPRLIFILEGFAQTSPFEFGEAVDQLDSAVRAADDTAEAIELSLSDPELEHGQAVAVGKMLYDPDGASIANWPTYCPRRVGTLSPARVASLLGEPVEGTQLTSPRARQSL